MRDILEHMDRRQDVLDRHLEEYMALALSYSTADATSTSTSAQGRLLDYTHCYRNSLLQL